MLSVKQIKKLLHDESISGEQAEKIHDFGQALAEMIFSQWQKDITKKTSKFLNCSVKTGQLRVLDPHVVEGAFVALVRRHKTKLAEITGDRSTVKTQTQT